MLGELKPLACPSRQRLLVDYQHNAMFARFDIERHLHCERAIRSDHRGHLEGLHLDGLLDDQGGDLVVAQAEDVAQDFFGVLAK